MREYPIAKENRKNLEYFRAVDYYETAIREVSGGSNNSNSSSSEVSSAAATDLDST